MPRFLDRLFGHADDEPEERPRFLNVDRDDLWGQQDKQHPEPEAADTGNLTFRKYDRDDPWGRDYPDRERQPAYQPPNTDNLTFVQPRILATDPEPHLQPSGHDARSSYAERRYPDMQLPALTDAHRAAWDARYEARNWPRDGEGVPTAAELRADRDAAARGDYMDRLARTGEYSPEQLARMGDRYLGLEQARTAYDPPPSIEQPIDPEVYDLDVTDHVPGYHDLFTGAFIPDTPDVPEVDEIPLEIALVVGFEETPTSGEVHVYYQPAQELRWFVESGRGMLPG